MIAGIDTLDDAQDSATVTPMRYVHCDAQRNFPNCVIDTDGVKLLQCAYKSRMHSTTVLMTRAPLAIAVFIASHKYL